MAAIVSMGPIYVSTNSGLSWIETGAPIADWRSIAGSADGRVPAAWALRSVDPTTYSTYGAVYVSTNGGASWLLSPIPEDAQSILAVSADGARIAGCWSSATPSLQGRAYLSTDFGACWSSKPADYQIRCIAFSADNTTLAISSGSSINVSKNLGDTWHGVAGGKFSQIALSSDASTILAGGFLMWDFWLHVSTNAGLTWASADVPLGDWHPATSADGRKFVAGGFVDDFGMSLYTSPDAGATWAEGPRFPTSTASFCVSADANTIAAAGLGTGIHILQSTPKPRLEICQSSNPLKLSWVVPSRPFTLQESASPTLGNWVNVVEEPTLNYTNLHYELTLPPAPGPRFFRLESLPVTAASIP
jgi:photosystem II stability/assembly factor-like uncharacterized protein